MSERDLTQLPQDRFARAERTGRVGAHRIKARPRVFWKYLVACAVIVAVFSGIGIGVLAGAGGEAVQAKVAEKTATKSAQKPAEAKIDKTATVVVLNGSGLESLDTLVADTLKQKSLGQVVLADDAAQPVQISAVFYKKAADVTAATALAQRLGGISPYLTTDYKDYDARLIVLLGKDYRGPGYSEAAKEAGDKAGE